MQTAHLSNLREIKPQIKVNFLTSCTQPTTSDRILFIYRCSVTCNLSALLMSFPQIPHVYTHIHTHRQPNRLLLTTPPRPLPPLVSLCNRRNKSRLYRIISDNMDCINFHITWQFMWFVTSTMCNFIRGPRTNYSQRSLTAAFAVRPLSHSVSIK